MREIVAGNIVAGNIKAEVQFSLGLFFPKEGVNGGVKSVHRAE